jgi:hypothetical protein
LEGLTQMLLRGASRPAAGGVLLDGVALAGAPRELGLRALAALLQQVSGAPYRPRFESLQRLFDRLLGGTALLGHLRGGATLSGCRLGPAPAGERVFGPATLKLTPEKPRKKPAKVRQSSAKIGRQAGLKVARVRQTA